MTASPPVNDLVVLAAADQAAAADAAWTAARRRFHLAPHGAREARLTALREAAEEALRAGLALRSAHGQGRP